MTTWQLHWRLARYRPGLYLLNCVLWGASAVLPLATGLAMKAFFDALSGAAPVGANVWTPIAVVTGIAAARMAAGLWGTWTFATFWQTIATLVTRNVVEWLAVAPGTRRLPDSPGEAVSRFRDDVREVLMYLDRWIDLTGAAAFIVLGLGVMLSVNPLATVVVAAPLAATLLLTNRVGSRLRVYRRLNREATGKVTDFVGELFGAVQAVKVASAERRAIRHFERLNETRRIAALKDRLFSELLRSVNANMANVAIGAVLLLAATGAGGRFTVGDFALFVSYLTRMAQWINFLGEVLAQHKRVGVSYDRLVAMLEGAPPARLVAPAPVHLHGDLPTVPVVVRAPADRLERLELRGLTYRHPTRAGAPAGRGVEGIDLTIERGTLTVVTGPIGSGKTTLLRVLLGLLPRGGGEILWNGQPVEDPAAFFVPPRCAYTPQVPRLFSESLRDNVLLGQPDDVLEWALWLAVMERDVASFPEGLDTLVGPRGVRLSGGQIQRTAAARMFARMPELLVFDDLSSALDLETERRLWDRLFGDGRDAAPSTGGAAPNIGGAASRPGAPTCLVVSHREAVLRRADRVIVLADGRLESREPHEELGWTHDTKIRASSPS